MIRVLVLSSSLENASYHQRVGLYVEPLRTLGVQLCPRPYPPIPGRLQLARRAAEYDILWLRRKTIDPWTGWLLRRSSTPIVYDFDDAIMFRTTPRHGSHRSRARERRFARTVRSADVVLAGSSHLGDLARPLNPETHVVPTGLDASRYVQRKRPATEPLVRLVWIGSRITLGFLLEKHDLFRNLARRYPSLRLRVICNTFPEWDDVPVEAVEWSREDENVHLAASDIGISHLPDTPFTRGKCGFKLIQCMAAALPVVASPVGCHAEIVDHGVNGFLAGSDEEWIEAIERLIGDPKLREEMGRRGRKTVEVRYDVRVLAPRIAALLQRLAGGFRGGR